MPQDISQVKGNTVVIWGAVSFANLDKEDTVTYDIGARGESYGSLKSIVHVMEEGGSIVSGVTVKVPKGAPEVALMLLAAQSQIPYPLVIRDSGVGINVAMATANLTLIENSSTTGDNTKETISFTFRGNLAILAS